MSIDLSIITLNWKVAPLVAELLESVAMGEENITYEILVADNASNDGIEDVIERFRKRHAHVPLTFLKHPKNLGFAAGNNPAIRLARGRYVVLLNPDARVTPDALGKMVIWLDDHAQVGVAGPKLFNPDGTLQPSVRRDPGLLDQSLILLKFFHVARGLPPFRRYFADDFRYNEEAEVEQLMGAAFFVRREVFEEIGLLDERFFIWFEEVDFCKRAREAGWKVAYVPSVEVVHHRGASFAQALTYPKQRMFVRSLLSYFRKHRGAASAALLAVPAAFGLAAAALYTLWNSSKNSR